MAIGSVSDLREEIRKITDTSFGDFEDFPENAVEVASRWAEVIDMLGADVSPPSTTATAAKLAFESVMLGAASGGIPVLIAACQAYALALSVGMLPAFAGVPPILPPPIAPTGVITLNADLEATVLAGVLRVWLGTGTAVNVSSGAVILWT